MLSRPNWNWVILQVIKTMQASCLYCEFPIPMIVSWGCQDFYLGGGQGQKLCYSIHFFLRDASVINCFFFFIFIHASFMSYIKWEINQVLNRLQALCYKFHYGHKRLQFWARCQIIFYVGFSGRITEPCWVNLGLTEPCWVLSPNYAEFFKVYWESWS